MDVFLERQEVRRKSQWKGRLKQVERILLSTAIVLAGLAGVYGLYRLVFLGEAFAVDRIMVEGVWSHLSAEAVATRTGVHQGDNLFFIDVTDVHDRLRSDPWVRASAVRRRLPDTLWVYVEEYRPAAIIAGQGFFYVDDRGDIFKRLESEDDRSYPALTGVALDEHDKLTDEGRGQVATMLQVMDAFASSRFGGEQTIAEVNYDPVRGYSVVTSDPPMQVVLGMERPAERVQAIDRVHRAIARWPGRIRYMMANENGRIIVRYQTS